MSDILCIFEFKVCPAGEADLLELSVGLWHDSPGMVSGSGSFLGEIRIPLKGHQQREATARDAWYRLQPRRLFLNIVFLNVIY